MRQKSLAENLSVGRVFRLSKVGVVYHTFRNYVNNPKLTTSESISGTLPEHGGGFLPRDGRDIQFHAASLSHHDLTDRLGEQEKAFRVYLSISSLLMTSA
jgi:hypothetical protein